MRFTGPRLLLVLEGLQELATDVHNQIVTCPEPDFFKMELAAYEHKLASINWLIAKAQQAITRERELPQKLRKLK